MRYVNCAECGADRAAGASCGACGYRPGEPMMRLRLPKHVLGALEKRARHSKISIEDIVGQLLGAAVEAAIMPSVPSGSVQQMRLIASDPEGKILVLVPAALLVDLLDERETLLKGVATKPYGDRGVE